LFARRIGVGRHDSDHTRSIGSIRPFSRTRS
jgi:hypothetical protein